MWFDGFFRRPVKSNLQARYRRAGVGRCEPRSRRMLLEPLEERRLLSLGNLFPRLHAPSHPQADSQFGYLAAGDADPGVVGAHDGGTGRDEANGQPNATATGDDTGGIDDEDGVTFGSIRAGQLGASVTANVQNAPGGAKLDAWIDFNADGTWGGPFERIADSTVVADGDNAIFLDVPSWALDGATYARFRLSTAGGLAPGGSALDGEVEDHRVAIASPTLSAGAFAGQNVISLADCASSVFGADVDGGGNSGQVLANRASRAPASGDVADDGEDAAESPMQLCTVVANPYNTKPGECGCYWGHTTQRCSVS
jgi:hypothetical protein